jgi:putative peptidoglycan lipid II flippase
MLRGILTIGSLTMASRLLGLLRETLIAAFIGAGPLADAFVMANRIPNMFRRLFGEGAFNAAFVPMFAELRAKEGQGVAERFAAEAAAVMAFWLVGITIAAEIFMPELLAVMIPGYVADPQEFALVVTLARITFPYMPLICLTALWSGVLNGLDRFAAAAAAPVVFNLVSIGCMLGLRAYVPTVAHALAWGVSVSGLFQLALLIWAVRRAGLHLHLPRLRLTHDVRALFRRMGPGLIGAGMTQISQQIDIVIISFLPASTASVLYFAERVNQLPLGIIGVSIGTALLPTLARHIQAGAPDEAKASLNRALEYALALTLPAAFGLMAAGTPIIATLYQHGAFDAAATIITAQALSAYAIGLPAFVLVKLLTPPFFAVGDTSTPFRVALVSIAINLALNLAFMRPLQHLGPALASSISSWINIAVLAVLLHRRGLMQWDARLKRAVPLMAAAGLLMVGAVWLAREAIYAPLAGDSITRLIGLCAVIGIGLAVYGLVGQVIGAFNVRALRPGRWR